MHVYWANCKKLIIANGNPKQAVGGEHKAKGILNKAKYEWKAMRMILREIIL
jgi:hypothetical protein